MNSRSFFISIGLHAFIAALAFIGLPTLNRPLPNNQPLLVMEVVRSVPKTNVISGGEINTDKKEQKSERRKVPSPPPPMPVPADRKNTSKPETKLSDPAAEIIPDKVKKKLKSAKTPSLAPPKSKSKIEAKKQLPSKLPKATPKRVNKMLRKNALAKKRKDALSGVMQNLAKAKAVSKEAEIKRREKERKELAEKLNKSLSVAAGDVLKAPEKPIVGPLGLADKDRLAGHLSKCWDPPIGAAGSDTLIVDIIVSLDRGGRVLSAKVEDKFRFHNEKNFKVAAEEAIRATKECSPLPLPPEKYEEWKSFIMVFDPSFLSR